MVLNQFNIHIKAFRTDNGTEFINHRVETLFKDNGILHQRSCIYSPQQNGIVERRHKILLESARAIMFESGVPLKFWPYSILTATWLLNRSPSRILHWDSPYDILFKKQPNYNQIKPFGCLAYAVNLTTHRNQFLYRNGEVLDNPAPVVNADPTSLQPNVVESPPVVDTDKVDNVFEE